MYLYIHNGYISMLILYKYGNSFYKFKKIIFFNELYEKNKTPIPVNSQNIKIVERVKIQNSIFINLYHFYIFKILD